MCLLRRLAFCLTVIVGTGAFADMEKPLYLREYWGVERTQEMFSGGIPIPKGLVPSADYVSLCTPGGAPVPVQSRPLMRWPDGSLRWLLLTFPGDAVARYRNEYRVKFHRDAPAAQPAPANPVTVTEGPDHVTLNTGVLILKIRKSGGFNLFDQVLIDRDGDGGVDDEIVASSMNNGATITDLLGGTYTSANDPAFSVRIEERGPLRAVVRIEGNHSNGTDDHRFYGYLCRVYAYADQRRIDVEYTMKNSYFPDGRGPLGFRGMGLNLKTNLTGTQTVSFYGTAPYQAALEDSAFVFQPYEYTFEARVGGNVVQGGMDADSLRGLGWVDVSDATGGVTVGIQEFASNCPNEIFVARNGFFEMRLWPYRYEQGSDSVSYSKLLEDRTDTDRFFLGIAEHKTHKTSFYFHAGSAETARSADIMNGFNHPLIPQMSREWVSLSRAVPGELFPDTLPVVEPSALLMPLINKPLSDSTYTKGAGLRRDYNDKGYYDSWATFGERKGRNNTDDTEIFEDQGTRYYRYYSPFIHRLFRANAWLYADFHQINADGLCGFTIPIRTHTWLYNMESVKDPVHSGELPYKHQWIPVANSNTYAHFTNRDLFMYYLTSGDLKIREALYAFTEMVTLYRQFTMNTYTEVPYRGGVSRSHGSSLSSMWMAARVENDMDSIEGMTKQAYYDTMLTRVMNGMAGHQKSGLITVLTDSGTWELVDTDKPKPWMEAIVDLPFCWYMEYYPDDTLQSYLNRHITAWKKFFGPECRIETGAWAPEGPATSTSSSHFRVPGPAAHLYYYSQDAEFAGKLDSLCLGGTNRSIFYGIYEHARWDKTGQQGYLFYYHNKEKFLSNPIITWDYDPTSEVAAEQGLPDGETAFLSVSPNPFNPAVRIRVPGARQGNGKQTVLTIHDVLGRVVERLEVKPNQTTVWHAKHVPSGVYVIKYRAGNRQFIRRIVLQK